MKGLESYKLKISLFDSDFESNNNPFEPREVRGMHFEILYLYFKAVKEIILIELTTSFCNSYLLLYD